MDDKQIVKKQVINEIAELRRDLNNKEVKSNIDGIWVFSGPGTVFQPLKHGENLGNRWMDRNRIFYGIAIARIVTAQRLHKKVIAVTRKDIRESGPFLVYNGIPLENNHFRQLIQPQSFILPPEKIIILDNVEEANTFHPIENTYDQIVSFSQYLEKVSIFDQLHLALISHVEHFPRILRYLAKYIPNTLRIELYPLSSNNEIRKQYEEYEAKKIWEYIQKGYLSREPLPVEM